MFSNFNHLGRCVLAGALLGLGLGQANAQGCVHTVTHSGANFQGGSFVLQAGFVDNEAAAASYVLSASEFPVKVNLIEMIFGTQNASVQTVTEWEVFVYDGTPTNGSLVASFQSDDTILPHMRIGPGTAGTNVQFSVDPGDPEQIFINNVSGTNTVTVGYRILRHNSPPLNPCLFPPSSTMNAFPSTDADGNLFKPQQNWIYAIDCGGLGAPAGWSTFGSLPTIFRPTGDWNIRFTYESVNGLQITDQPDDVVTSPGQTAVFQVVASGADPKTYQWFKGSTPLSNSSRIIGATTDSLVILNVNSGDVGNYRVVVTNACGTATSQDAILSFNRLLSGTVTLGNWTATPNGQPIQLALRQVGGFSDVWSGTVNLNASSAYQVQLPGSITAGNYDVFAKGSHWLRRKLGSVSIPASGAITANFSLINGDVDGNNEVGPGDFSNLANTFGTEFGGAGYLANADLDGNLEVGPSDFAILSNNFGQEGD